MARNVLTKKRLEWEGLPELQRNVDKLLAEMGHREGRKMADSVKRVLMGAALTVRDEARQMAPSKSGLLSRAIFAAYGDERKPDVLVGVNRRMAPHAHLQEYGSSRNPAQPYMRPAITATRGIAANMVADGLKKIIADNLPK